jgi:hypothetical protein
MRRYTAAPCCLAERPLCCSCISPSPCLNIGARRGAQCPPASFAVHVLQSVVVTVIVPCPTQGIFQWLCPYCSIVFAWYPNSRGQGQARTFPASVQVGQCPPPVICWRRRMSSAAMRGRPGLRSAPGTPAGQVVRQVRHARQNDTLSHRLCPCQSSQPTTRTFMMRAM